MIFGDRFGRGSAAAGNAGGEPSASSASAAEGASGGWSSDSWWSQSWWSGSGWQEADTTVEVKDESSDDSSVYDPFATDSGVAQPVAQWALAAVGDNLAAGNKGIPSTPPHSPPKNHGGAEPLPAAAEPPESLPSVEAAPIVPFAPEGKFIDLVSVFSVP